MRNVLLGACIAVLVRPAIGNAGEAGLRIGLETPIYTHYSENGVSGSFSIGDTFQPSITVLLEYYSVSLIGVGLEAREGFLATGTKSNCVGPNCSYQRTGTSVGPNLTLDLTPVPVYGRAALPIHVEPGDVRMDFRLAGGVKLAVFYAEVLADFPLAGTGVSAFGQQQLGFGAGIWLKF